MSSFLSLLYDFNSESEDSSYIYSRSEANLSSDYSDLDSEMSSVTSESAPIESDSQDELPMDNEDNNLHESEDEESVDVPAAPVFANAVTVHIEQQVNNANESSPILRKRSPSPDIDLNQTAKKACHNTSDDSMMCIICFEPWCNSGDHRLVSLKCGHLFGSKCIEKWIKQNSSCPQCNKKSYRKDIRIIYAKTLVALDTSERDRALAELDNQRQECRRLELENSTLAYKITTLEEVIRDLKQKVDSPVTIASTCPTSSSSMTSNIDLEHLKTLVLCQNKGCRVMAYSERLQLLAVSQCSSNPLFPGFGIRKIDLIEMKSSEFFLIHQNEIRDLAFNPVSSDLLLSVSVDKSAKLFNVVTNTVLHSYHHLNPAWACCWNTDNPHQFFVGLQNGTLYLYDTLRQGETEPISLTPGNPHCLMITKLLYVRKNSLENYPHGGLFVTSLSGCMFYESRSQQFIPHFLAIEGRFTSVVMDDRTSHILLASRISKSYNFSRILLCTLGIQSLETSDDSGGSKRVHANIIQTYKSSCPMKNISHSIGLFPNPQDSSKLFVILCKENPCELVIWDCEGQVIRKLPTSDPVLEVLNIFSNNRHLLCLLSGKSVVFYEWK